LNTILIYLYFITIILIGSGYDPKIENDILLLDISNDEEYIWTNLFDPSSPLPLPTPTPTTTSTPTSKPTPTPTPIPTPSLPISQPDKSNNTPVVVDIFIGYLIIGIFLLLGGFFLYNWNNSKAKSKLGNIESNNDNRENLLILIRNHINDYGTANITNIQK